MTLGQPLRDAPLDFLDGHLAEAGTAGAAAAVALGDHRPAPEQDGGSDGGN
jgi:hypothetical protein